MKNEFSITPLSKCLTQVIDYRGKTPKKLGKEWSTKGYRVLSANNVKFGGLDKLDSINYADENLYKAWMKEDIKRGDLLLTSEAPSGQVMIWDSDEKIVLSQRLYALRTGSLIDSKYLKYYIQSPIGQKEIFRNNSGSTVAGISAKTFDNILIRHPSKVSQERIGEFLYSLDKKIEINNRINSQLEAIAKTLYGYWFVQFDFLNAEGKPYKTSGGKMVYNPILKREIPQGWAVKTLGDLVELVKGNVSPIEIEPSTPYVGLEHIQRKKIAFEDWATADMASSDKTVFKRGDILFGKIRPYFHKVTVAPFDGITSTDTIVMRPRKKSFLGFALETVFSEEFVELASKSATGSKMPRADWNILIDYPIAIPSDLLLDKFQMVFEKLVCKLNSSALENKKLGELRDWLLPMLMNGQVIVR